MGGRKNSGAGWFIPSARCVQSALSRPPSACSGSRRTGGPAPHPLPPFKLCPSAQSPYLEVRYGTARSGQARLSAASGWWWPVAAPPAPAPHTANTQLEVPRHLAGGCSVHRPSQLQPGQLPLSIHHDSLSTKVRPNLLPGTEVPPRNPVRAPGQVSAAAAGRLVTTAPCWSALPR